MNGLGVYAASVTPFSESGEIDFESLAKLLAYFEASGCKGVVLAGTNGEGPSLSAVEKRDLFRRGIELGGGLEIICGISTPSLHEATWLASQADRAGAAGVLLMAPGYFRSAERDGIFEFFREVAESCSCGVLAYNFPKYTGFEFDEEFVSRVSDLNGIVGFKDSSGCRENLDLFRGASREDMQLYVGDESLLIESLEKRWSGTISGASNLIAPFLAQIVLNWEKGEFDAAREKFKVVLPAIQAIRSYSQPVTTKAVLAEWDVIARREPRVPLLAGSSVKLSIDLKSILGIDYSNIGI